MVGSVMDITEAECAEWFQGCPRCDEKFAPFVLGRSNSIINRLQTWYCDRKESPLYWVWIVTVSRSTWDLGTMTERIEASCYSDEAGESDTEVGKEKRVERRFVSWFWHCVKRCWSPPGNTGGATPCTVWTISVEGGLGAGPVAGCHWQQSCACWA